MTTKYYLKKNSLGYMEIFPKPSIDEIEAYYRDKYYQLSLGAYQKSYSDDEISYFDAEADICIATINKYTRVKESLLDIGCGEGHFSRYFLEQGWDIKSVDFSIEGIKKNNPSVMPYFEQGDIMSFLQKSSNEELKYGLINLDNVLEHVLEPRELLLSLKSHLSNKTVLRIQVPNDFSKFQTYLVEMDATEETWVQPPEHLTYFNKQSLKNLVENIGLKIISMQADYPIEQFLISDNSNYSKNPNLGKAAHLTRVLTTNFLVNQNVQRLVDYYEAAADLEFGRLLTVYVQLA
ncbi:class I SAM-dependent methyltransferase [Gammaproteobacteria bacterium]|jgi:2-polyprenyl-3-methyl-5-hydroxy-6-metoxy-1,4-benzoquinol methylase|nr:class I SAM-dependent methyltransferase [Gammaproteobacteria bacterium]